MPNLTGIPIQMKQDFERGSGLSFDDVRVHYQSEKPAALGSAAYTQGTQVYIGPGQERYLPHELGHVVQQKMGILKGTIMHHGGPTNRDPSLEQEADRIAARRGSQSAESSLSEQQSEESSLSEQQSQTKSIQFQKDFTGISIGIEQEVAGCNIKILIPEDYQGKVATVYETGSTDSLVAITSDDGTGGTYTLEFVVHPTELNDYEGWRKRMGAMKYIVAHIKGLAVKNAPLKEVSEASYSIKLDPKFMNTEVEIRFSKLDNESRSFGFGNQMSVGLPLQDQPAIDSFLAKNSASWYEEKKYSPKDGSEEDVLTEEEKWVFNYICCLITEYMERKNEYDPSGDHPDALLESRVKNQWTVLPRTPIPHILKGLGHAGRIKDAVRETISCPRGMEKQVFDDSVSKILDEGMMPSHTSISSTINGETALVFELRSVNGEWADYVYSDERTVTPFKHRMLEYYMEEVKKIEAPDEWKEKNFPEIKARIWELCDKLHSEIDTQAANSKVFISRDDLEALLTPPSEFHIYLSSSSEACKDVIDKFIDLYKEQFTKELEDLLEKKKMEKEAQQSLFRQIISKKPH